MLRVAVATTLCFIAGTVLAQTSGQVSCTPWSLSGTLLEPDGDILHDFSGLACSNGDNKYCAVINDEDTSALYGKLEVTGLNLSRKIDLIGSEPSASTVGTPPTEIGCSAGKKKFKDLDGEAVAFSNGYFYVVGSHGCSRHKNAFHLSSFIVARFRVDQQGSVINLDGTPLQGSPGLQQVATSYRVSDVLQKADDFSVSFAKDLSPPTNGLNVEGLAIVGSTAYIGLRAPVLNSQATIVSAPVDEIFRSGHDRFSGQVKVLKVPVRPDEGIRDLAALSDGRLLALTGPAQEGKLDPRLILIDPKNPATAREVAKLSGGDIPSEQAKAEGLLVLKEEGTKLGIVLLFDSAPRGAPRLCELQLPQ
jgi:hypothetical protein